MGGLTPDDAQRVEYVPDFASPVIATGEGKAMNMVQQFDPAQVDYSGFGAPGQSRM